MRTKLLNILLLLTGSGFIFASCDNINVASSESDLQTSAVQFSTQIYAAQTRTTADGDLWLKGDQIGIFMLDNGSSLNTSSVADNAENIAYTALNDSSSLSSFTSVDTDIYYPVGGKYVDFVAYYPHNNSLSNYITSSNYFYPVDVSNQSNPADIDVLYANTANTQGAGYNNKSGIVGLEFKHALGKLSFTMAPGSNSPDLTGAKVEIIDVATKGDMSLADGTTTTTNSGQTIEANISADGLTCSIIMIPQDISGKKIQITLADNRTFDGEFPADTKILAGNNYISNSTVDAKVGIKSTVLVIQSRDNEDILETIDLF